MIDFSRFNSIIQIMQYFRSESVCRSAIIESRWICADGSLDVVCPYCGHHHCRIGYNGRFVCTGCKNKFSCLVGTIFENTKISLRKWFIAMYMISSNKKGVSSCQIARDCVVTQKTAWYMLQKLRTLFNQDEKVFEGEVELDEVYIGGKEKFKHKSKRVKGTQGRSTKTKTPVFGMMKRTKTGSSVYACVVDQTDRNTLLPIVSHKCKPGSHLYTDELSAYSPLSSLGYDHSVVNHGVDQYVDGGAYTNTIECFWAHLRRMISGTYHSISSTYLQRYIDEEVFRWNHRKMKEGNRFRLMFIASTKVISYKMVRM